MIWVLYAPLNFVVMVLCYLLNWFVCLFCNEEGELPRAFKLFQTWDDSCNPRFFIVEDHIPSWLKYDYDKHYKEYWGTTPELAEVGRDRCFARVIDGNFTLKERLQRYICRVLWLTRNCGYGFAFWFFGKKVDGKDMVYVKQEEKMSFAYDKTKKATIGLDACGVVDPWALVVVKRVGSSASTSTPVPGGKTVGDHVLHYALDLDGNGIIEGASVGGAPVDVRATAIVWSCGKDGVVSSYPYAGGGKGGGSKGKSDDVYSWTPGQTRNVK